MPGKSIKRKAFAFGNAVAISLCRSMVRVGPFFENRNLQLRERPARLHARMLGHLGRHDEALSFLGRMATELPNAHGLASDLGEALVVAGRHEEALCHWQKHLELAPSNDRFWFGYVRLLRRLKRFGDIDAALERRLSTSGAESALSTVGLVQEFSPLSFDSIARKAEYKIGEDAKLLRRLAALHARDGDLGTALGFLDRARGSKLQPWTAHLSRLRIKRSFKKLQSMTHANGSISIDDLRLPEDALATAMRQSVIAPLHARQGLSMAVTTLGPGGAERQLTNTVNGLRKHGLLQQIKIVQTRRRDSQIDGFYQSQFGEPKMSIIAVNDEAIDIEAVVAQRGEHVRSLLALLPKSLKRYVARYMTEFAKTQPQIVHCWSDQRNMTAGVAAVIMGVPRVVLSTRSIAPPGNRFAPRHFPSVYRALLACPNVRIINNSRAGAATYEAWLGIESGSIGVIYNGVDVDSLHKSRDAEKTMANRQCLGLSDETRLVGSLIRFTSEKRPRLWLEAAARLSARDPNVHFVLIGDGVERARAEAYSRELGIADRVHFIGLVKGVVPWYGALDVVLLTSSREGTSNTLLEAQALGVPVVATDVGGMREAMFPGESGFLVGPEPSPDEIAERLGFVLDNELWRRKAASAGEAFIRERFSIERMTRDTFDLYAIEPPMLKQCEQAHA